MLAGEWPYFSHTWFKVGFPPDWHANVLDGTQVDDRSHWSEIDLNAIHDVKFVWEPSRFSIIYLLVRAYAVDRDERYADAFWQLIEDWGEHNPPNHGVNWASGQELAVRVMAWCFGLYAFLESPSSAAERVWRLVRMIEEHGERIAGFIEYALAQRNNHGISEAVGLFTIGILFPQLRRAGNWQKTGRDQIVKQLQEQVYADGSYIQHSFNYQRVLIDGLLWAFRLGELNGCPFPEESYQTLRRAVAFMLRFCDPRSGRMPNYGGNDGASILPLTSSDYSDFRPSLQAVHYLIHRDLVFAAGTWSEELEWLFGSGVESREVQAGDRKQQNGVESSSVETANFVRSGYLKLQARESWAMLRAARYTDRPAQADQLHLDLWWRGENIACDAGTYLYRGPPPWTKTNALAATAVHNTVTVAGRDQMTRAGRFLWLDWAQAESAHYRVGEHGNAVAAWHDGYDSIGAMHTRSVLSIDELDCWIVVDDVVEMGMGMGMGTSSESSRLHWLLPDCQFAWEEDECRLWLQTPAGPFQCCLHVPAESGVSLARSGQLLAGADSSLDSKIRGWRSLYYGEKIPALSLAAEHHVPARFITLLAPVDPVLIAVGPTDVRLRSNGSEYGVALRVQGSERIFSGVSVLPT